MCLEAYQSATEAAGAGNDVYVYTVYQNVVNLILYKVQKWLLDPNSMVLWAG